MDASVASDLGISTDGAVSVDLSGGPDLAGPGNTDQGGGCQASGSGALGGALFPALLVFGLFLVGRGSVARARRRRLTP